MASQTVLSVAVGLPQTSSAAPVPQGDPRLPGANRTQRPDFPNRLPERTAGARDAHGEVDEACEERETAECPSNLLRESNDAWRERRPCGLMPRRPPACPVSGRREPRRK